MSETEHSNESPDVELIRSVWEEARDLIKKLEGTTVQRLFCDAGVHRVFVAGRSSILDYGTTTRTVPANLFNALVIRDRHCRFPGCDRPPEWCEAHHVRWVLDGGPTITIRSGRPLGTRGRTAGSGCWYPPARWKD